MPNGAIPHGRSFASQCDRRGSLRRRPRNSTSGSAFVGPALAQKTPDPAKGFHKYKVGSIEVTALYDGIWEKPHDPAFIKNARVEETKAALAKAGLTTEFMPIPLTVVVLKIGRQADHGGLPARASASGSQQQAACRPTCRPPASIPGKIGTILISHFHPDHIFGLMEKGTNAPIFPNAELVVSATEYKWWTEPGRVEKLPEARKALGQRINAVFPRWKNFTLVEGETGGGARRPPRQCAGPHARAIRRSSSARAAQQLMISNDTAYVPALLGAASGMAGRLRPGRPDGRGDAPQADRPGHCREDDDLRRPLPVPGAGAFVKDGNGYVFTPAKRVSEPKRGLRPYAG